MRHGETDGNAAGTVQGQTGGTGLSERGWAQVRAAAASLAGARVRPASVVSSDLERCRQTAGVLADALGLPVTEDPGLRERSFGALEGGEWGGLDETALASSVGVVGGLVVDPWARPPRGESVADLADRVARALARAARRPGPVLVVTHGGPIRVTTATGGLPGMAWPPVPHATPLAVCLGAHRRAG